MALSKRIEKNVDLTYFEGEIPVNYVYTYGLGLEKFFRALKDKGEFLACRCPDCGAVYLPCRIFCERCFAEINKTFKVSGNGTIFSYTVCHLNMDGSEKKEPDVVGLVEMDGTEGAKMLHLIDAKPEKVKIGMKVKPVLRPASRREGEIFDIKGFKPV
jgi:hypothetical protein